MRKWKRKSKIIGGSQTSIASSVNSINATMETTDSINNVPLTGGYQIKNIKKELPFKLHRAAWKNNDEKVAKLIDEKDRKGNPKHSLLAVDKRKRTALHLAACGQNLRIIELLLTREGAEALKMQDDEGNNPLHKAVECDRYTVIIKLERVRSCKDAANMKNNAGQTPLHIAARNNDEKGGDKILTAGGYVDYKDNDGNTPLAVAVLSGSLDIVDLLKGEDAMADSTNNKGETPLILAVCSRNFEMVKKLLSFNMINPELKDDANKSALDYAEELDSDDILNELKQAKYGAPPNGITGVTQHTELAAQHHRPSVTEEDDKLSLEEDSINTFSDSELTSTPMKTNTTKPNFYELLKGTNEDDNKEEDESVGGGTGIIHPPTPSIPSVPAVTVSTVATAITTDTTVPTLVTSTAPGGGTQPTFKSQLPMPSEHDDIFNISSSDKKSNDDLSPTTSPKGTDLPNAHKSPLSFPPVSSSQENKEVIKKKEEEKEEGVLDILENWDTDSMESSQLQLPSPQTKEVVIVPLTSATVASNDSKGWDSGDEGDTESENDHEQPSGYVPTSNPVVSSISHVVPTAAAPTTINYTTTPIVTATTTVQSSINTTATNEYSTAVQTTKPKITSLTTKPKSDVEELLSTGWDSSEATETDEEKIEPVEYVPSVLPMSSTPFNSSRPTDKPSSVLTTVTSSLPRPTPLMTTPFTTTSPRVHTLPISSQKMNKNPMNMLPTYEPDSSTDDDDNDEGSIGDGGVMPYPHTRESMPMNLSSKVTSPESCHHLTQPSRPIGLEPKSSTSLQVKDDDPAHHDDPFVLSPLSTNEESIPDSHSLISKQDAHSLRKYGEVCEEKRKIEKIKMDQEVEIRQLKYKIEELEEELKSANEDKDKLLDQLKESEDMIATELCEKQNLELNTKEIELENKTLKASLQQKVNELDEIRGHLLAERRESSLKAASLTQQQQLYETLKSESTVTTEQYNKLYKELESSGSTQRSLEDKISELESLLASMNERLTTALNDKMKLLSDVDVAEEKTAEIEAKLREEKDNATAQLHEKHALELRVQELEIKQENLLVAKQQITKELNDTKVLLKAEQDSNTAKESDILTKDKLYVGLQEEIKKISDENVTLSTNMEGLKHDKGTLESRVSDLEQELNNVNSRLASELTAKLQLLKDIGEAERKVEERRAIHEEDKTRHLMTVESIKADLKRSESEGSARLEQIMSLKEKLSSIKASKSMLEKDIQNFKRELSSSLDTKAQLEEKVYSIDRAYEELDKERDRLSEVINQMGQEASTKEQELEEVKSVTMKYQEVVEKAQETLKYTATERDEALAEKSIAQSQVIEFEGKLNAILVDLDQCVQREKSLLDEVEQLKKSRSSLQDLATKVRSENVSLEHQLADERVQRERFEAENKELKEIWESEVKTKHKLTDKIMELELVQKEANGTAHQEKRKIKKIVEQKEIMQLKIDTLQEKNTQLQRENGECKASLREVKKQVKLMESRRQDELNLSKMADSSEIIGLHQKISQLQEKIKYEAELKVVAEDKIRQLQHELTLAHKLLDETKQEVSEVLGRRRKEEKKITNLTEELNRLQDHLSQLTVPKEQYDAVNSELKESYYENQKMARDISDSKHKLKTLLSDMDKLRMDKVAAEAETLRYKEMLDREVSKRDTLTARLENARKRTSYSKSRVDMERLETERLLEDSRRKYGHKSQFTSTPSFNHRSSPVDDNLLQDVRDRLDRSIASHRDSTMSYSMLGGSLNETETKKESHLESIKRQYRLH